MVTEPDRVRISFFLAGAPTAEGSAWHLPGEPGFQPKFWARAGDVFDRCVRADGADEERVALSVLEIAEDHAIVSGDLPGSLGSGDILLGERDRSH